MHLVNAPNGVTFMVSDEGYDAGEMAYCVNAQGELVGGRVDYYSPMGSESVVVKDGNRSMELKTLDICLRFDKNGSEIGFAGQKCNTRPRSSIGGAW